MSSWKREQEGKRERRGSGFSGVKRGARTDSLRCLMPALWLAASPEYHPHEFLVLGNGNRPIMH